MRAGVGVHPAVAGRAQAQQVRVRFPALERTLVRQVVSVIPGRDKPTTCAPVVHRTAEPFAARRPHRSPQVTVDFAAVGGLAAQQQRRSLRMHQSPGAANPRGYTPDLCATCRAPNLRRRGVSLSQAGVSVNPRDWEGQEMRTMHLILA
jgi:hypothetical protein